MFESFARPRAPPIAVPYSDGIVPLRPSGEADHYYWSCATPAERARIGRLWFKRHVSPETRVRVRGENNVYCARLSGGRVLLRAFDGSSRRLALGGRTPIYFRLVRRTL